MIYEEPTKGKSYIYILPDLNVALQDKRSVQVSGIERVTYKGRDEAGCYLFSEPNGDILVLNSLYNIINL